MEKTKSKGVVMVKEGTGLANEDWYRALVEDCQAIKVELEYEARKLLIQVRWEMGKRIFEANEGMNHEKVYGQKIILNLSKDIGMSPSHLFAMVKFFKDYPEKDFEKDVVPKLPEGKNTSWSKLSQGYYDKKEDVEKKDKTSYTIKDILEVVRLFLKNDIGLVKESEIDDAVIAFHKLIVKKKG
jgi:hypothetical protein